ncbi:MAG TPA: cupin domain-containing protein [Burkholderiaceae bacterium]|nr:cupin domain-containing protein [Burkholderiaceae bacterium]
MSERVSDRANELRRTLIRNVREVPLERQQREPLYDTHCGSVSDGTVASKLGAGYDILAPGKRGCPYHFHRAQEEMFVILEGEGSLRVAGEMVPVKAGDVVFIPPGPAYPHQFINTSAAPMRYLSISTQEEPEICEYPDSGKYGAFAKGFRGAQRTSANLDYWDGEP